MIDRCEVCDDWNVGKKTGEWSGSASIYGGTDIRLMLSGVPIPVKFYRIYASPVKPILTHLGAQRKMLSSFDQTRKMEISSHRGMMPSLAILSPGNPLVTTVWECGDDERNTRTLAVTRCEISNTARSSRQ
uniref:HECW1_helix domain-containing protein n=1 Tax=Steinernema glaseri TaxID=37863 RepID=A0A1I7XZK0_9BILA